MSYLNRAVKDTVSFFASYQLIEFRDVISFSCYLCDSLIYVGRPPLGQGLIDPPALV